MDQAPEGEVAPEKPPEVGADVIAISLNFDCPMCGAAKGNLCNTATGEMHVGRIQLMRTAAQATLAAEEEKRQRLIAEQDRQDYQKEVYERLRMQAELAHAGLKGLTVANGGAIVALFTFLGNAGARHLDPDALRWAFVWFGSGLALTLAAHIFGFVSQGKYMDATQQQAWNAQAEALGDKGKYDFTTPHKKGAFWEKFGVASAVLALVAFIAGAGFALEGVLP